MYRNVYDADAAVMGIYGKFMSLADRYVILNELRGDLLEYTNNADEYLRQISTHNAKADNPYASPRPFYELILNCNDVLKNFLIMKDKNSMKEVEFNQRYSDIACLRSFLYLNWAFIMAMKCGMLLIPWKQWMRSKTKAGFLK
ncbi:hypothetical protein [Paraflavitalea speifideaquila]|uniref:hypothetical protein n=1 Tax=Paraflavitalea speifideaquila TaxID=3076558 RepID=UPI0028F04811|nr:hypothetical protein [Paraflavitalea speifideiaquila]